MPFVRRRSQQRKHVLIVHRYFHPDTPPYAAILRDIVMSVADTGIVVTVFTCQPSYNREVARRAPARVQWGERIVIRRFGVFDDRRSTILKALNMLLFCARIAMASTRLGRIDAMMAASTPPILVAKMVSWIARFKRAAFVYHHQDIYPEITAAEGTKTRLFNWLRALDTATDHRAARVVVLSEDMRATMVDRGVDPERLRVLNNFDPWVLEGRPKRRAESDRTTVVYAGNLGHFQALDVVFEAIVALRDEPLDIHFIGDGPLRAPLSELVEREQLSSVTVHGYLAPDRVADFLSTRADVGLVTLRPGVIDTAYPSKTMSYLRNGVPVLAAVGPRSELSRSLLDTGAGWSADLTKPHDLVEVLTALARDRGQLSVAGEHAAELYSRCFSRQQALDRWSRMFTDLSEGRL